MGLVRCGDSVAEPRVCADERQVRDALPCIPAAQAADDRMTRAADLTGAHGGHSEISTFAHPYELELIQVTPVPPSIVGIVHDVHRLHTACGESPANALPNLAHWPSLFNRDRWAARGRKPPAVVAAHGYVQWGWSKFARSSGNRGPSGHRPRWRIVL